MTLTARQRWRIKTSPQLAMVNAESTGANHPPGSFIYYDANTGQRVRMIIYPEPNDMKIDWFPYKPGTPIPEATAAFLTGT